EDNNQRRLPIGIVFCHPFAEEKLISHRVMVNLARRLSSDGYYVLRFDFMGHGDSEGDFENATVQTRLSDIMCAVDFLRETVNIDRIGLLGIRFGATLASLASEMDKSIDFLFSIAPVINGGTYIAQCLRSNLATQMTTFGKIIKTREQLIQEMMEGKEINIDGYLISQTFYEQAKNINLMENIGNHQNRVYILQISKKENQPLNKSFQELFSAYKQKGYDISIYNVADDLFWTDLEHYNPEAKNLNQVISQLLLDIY
ncbi:MAG: alpha/beta hydrolase, partial [Thermotogota bacterium]|nr:alpha/beta hydrolase [Thermotogota bacterium]